MMTKKNKNTLVYLGILVLFVLLFLFTGTSTHVDAPLPIASAEQTISDAEIVQKLRLTSYNELQQELFDLQAKTNDSTAILYVKKQEKTVSLHLIKEDGSSITPLQFTLDEADSYDFNSTFSNLDALIQSNLGRVLLNGTSTWTESNYTSAKFPVLLDWNAAFAEKFKTLRSQKVTQNNTQVSANTTKAIHFFLWSTIEYMKAEQQQAIQYTITKDNASYVVTSAFFSFDHTTPKNEHKYDSIQQIKAFIEKAENTVIQKFTFTQNKNLLTLATATETFSIPLQTNSNSIKTIGSITPDTKIAISKVLLPILHNLNKADGTLTDWKETQFDATVFLKTLDLSIRDSRWKQFVASNNAVNVFDFFIETIAFQLDEIPQNTLSLQANTISNEVTSTFASTSNSLPSNILFILGIITSLFLIVQEQFSTKFSKKESPANTIVVTNTVKTSNIKTEQSVQTSASKKTKTDEEILQQQLKTIRSLEEVAKLPWKAAIEKELKFLIDHKEVLQKIDAAKTVKETAFLKNLKNIFPTQVDTLITQKEKAQLWDDFLAIKDKSALKKFLKRIKGIHKELPYLLELGIKYEAFEAEKDFTKALEILQTIQKFEKEATALVNVQETDPNRSIIESIQYVDHANSSLKNGVKDAKTIAKLLSHVITWATTFGIENARWQTVVDTIDSKQQAIQHERNNTKKLTHIQELYHSITNTKTDILNEVLTQFSSETQQLQKTHQQQLKTVKQEAALALSNLKTQAKEAHENLAASKKISDNNNKLIEKYFANLYDPYLKELQNKTKDLDHAELTKRLAFIAFNTMDLAKFVNDNWSADTQTEGNIRRIIRRESLKEIPKENYNPNTATAYINTVVAFLHKNGVQEVEHLIDGIDINNELKGLH